MTDFWRLIFPSIIWTLATVCDTLITFREKLWLLRLIWRFSGSVSEYEPVFRVCVWIIIHAKISFLIWRRNCWCCCVEWMELGQLWHFLHVKNRVKHFQIIFCFAIDIVKRLIMWNNTEKWKCKVPHSPEYSGWR